MTCTYQYNQQWLPLHVRSHGHYFGYCNTFHKTYCKLGIDNIDILYARM